MNLITDVPEPKKKRPRKTSRSRQRMFLVFFGPVTASRKISLVLLDLSSRMRNVTFLSECAEAASQCSFTFHREIPEVLSRPWRILRVALEGKMPPVQNVHLRHDVGRTPFTLVNPLGCPASAIQVRAVLTVNRGFRTSRKSRVSLVQENFARKEIEL